MIFSLEVLQAKQGDCLLLHFGKKQHPELFVIDGGPPGVYHSNLQPRLMQIKMKLSPDEPLPLANVMVSHLDDDHVNGVIQLVTEVVLDKQKGKTPGYEIENLWFNTFDDIIGNIEIPKVSAFQASASAASFSTLPQLIKNQDHSVQAIIASTGQGRKLRNHAKFLNVLVNNPFDEIEKGKGILVCSDIENNSIPWNNQLNITVIQPNHDRLLALQKQWDEDLKEAKAKGDDDIVFASIASNRDTSVFNLSSIVCLVEFEGKTILLTGDARSEDIYDGLSQLHLLDAEGKIHVDILKVPHHGSERNMTVDFFQKVTADHYFISANGKYNNPDKATLEMLSEATRGRDDFSIYLTNHTGQNNIETMLDAFCTREKKDGRTYKVIYRGADKLSLLIDLLDKIQY